MRNHVQAFLCNNREPDLPAYKIYYKAHHAIGPTDNAKRLKWVLEGPLHSAVEVMQKVKYEPHVPTEKYGEHTTSTTIWHPISKSPLTEPKVSSVIVHIHIVEDWEDQWLEFHRNCHHP